MRFAIKIEIVDMRHSVERNDGQKKAALEDLVHAYDGIKMHINPRDPDAREANNSI